MVYDYSTGNFYCATNNDWFGKVNIENGSITLIGENPLDIPGYVVAMACSKSGELYIISTPQTQGVEGIFYSVDKATGVATKIGGTGIVTWYIQSMAFDYKTGILYWVSYGSGFDHAFCTIDPATGKATVIGNFDGKKEITGLYFPYDPD